MTEIIQKKLSDSKAARWTALAIVAFSMLCGYFLTDVMSPLKPMLESELLWSSTDFGFFTSAYGWFNVFFLMLIFGGMILDKMGVRFTGLGSCLLMVIGCALKYAAIAGYIGSDGVILGWKAQVSPCRKSSLNGLKAKRWLWQWDWKWQLPELEPCWQWL